MITECRHCSTDSKKMGRIVGQLIINYNNKQNEKAFYKFVWSIVELLIGL